MSEKLLNLSAYRHHMKAGSAYSVIDPQSEEEQRKLEEYVAAQKYVGSFIDKLKNDGG